MIQWIQQEDRLGCAIATAAMIVGCSYQEAQEGIAPGWDGLHPPGGYNVDRWLKSKGVEIVRRSEHFYPCWKHQNMEEQGIPWPPVLPFADVHLCSVVPHGSEHLRHSVILLRDGTVLDPETPEPKRLSDYPYLETVWEVVWLESKS